MKRHCRTCTCGNEDRPYMDVTAPFFALVLYIDRLTHDGRLRPRQVTT